jgi:hypothetical protein
MMIVSMVVQEVVQQVVQSDLTDIFAYIYIDC